MSLVEQGQMEDIRRRLINLQRDVTYIMSVVGKNRLVLKTIEVRKHRDSDGNLECPICCHDVPKECGECEMCGQKLVWGD